MSEDWINVWSGFPKTVNIKGLSRTSTLNADLGLCDLLIFEYCWPPFDNFYHNVFFLLDLEITWNSAKPETAKRVFLRWLSEPRKHVKTWNTTYNEYGQDCFYYWTSGNVCFFGSLP
ncbi:hypothetical protein ACROYT_G008967 [Oculina patagonica]